MTNAARYTTLASRLARGLGACALAFAFAAVAQTPAGTLISNKASGTATGLPAATSNTVTVTVGAAGPVVGTFSAVLAASGTTESDPGGTVNFPHSLTNTGTTADSYNLAATDVVAGYGFASITMLPDANGDGVADSLVPITNPVLLAAGGVFRFVVRAVVPATATPGTYGEVRVTAASAGGAVIAPNTDRVTLRGMVVPLDCGTGAKWISADRGASPGGPVTITLTYDACTTARGRIVLTDPLPAGLRYVPGSARWTGAPGVVLTDAVTGTDRQAGPGGDASWDFGITTANTVTATAFAVPAGGRGSFTFQVDVISGLAAGTVIANTARYNLFDAQDRAGLNQPTNTVTYTVTGRADLELTGQRLPTATPGATAAFTNVLRNLGDAADTFDITYADSTFPAGTVFTLFQSDGVTPLADTNANGIPDTGVVAAGGTYNIILRARIPETAVPGTYKVTKTARSTRSPLRFASADDVVDTLATRCLVSLDPDNQALTGFGRHVTYTHFLTNRGNCDETVQAMLSYLADSLPGWTSRAFVDSRAGAGTIAGVLDPADAPIQQGWSMNLGPGQSVRILVDVLAPTEEAMAQRQAAKALIAANVTTLTLAASRTGALVVRDTTSLDDDKQDGTIVANVIRNHTDATYGVPTFTAVIGRSAWLQADAASCNAVANVVESRTVVLTGPNGERETVVATETGPNTGIFRVPAMAVRRAGTVVPGDGILQGRPGDVFEMDVAGCSARVSGVFTLIEPAGVVFDSRGNQGIAGARVTLLTASGGQCGGAATIPGGANPVTTDANGRYAFATAPAGDFCLRVAPPNGYAFPSRVSWPELPAGRNLVVSGLTSGGSYGTPFTAADGAIVVDLPLDIASQDGLFVQKLASRAVAELGEFVDYTVRVRNNTGNVLDRASVQVVDDLPAGFAYMPGSARREGVAVAEPLTRGARLTIALGSLARGQEVRLTYRVRLGPGALQGDGVNRVQATYATSGSITRSNIATAKVQVVGGVFGDRGFLLGKVFLDCNADGLQGAGERGMPGVRLFLEDGTFAVTDGAGKYSFYGLSNRTHVLKVDRTTLPPGARLALTSSRQLGDAGSRMVDLKSGELHRGDFAIAGCAAALVDEAAAREKALANDGADSLAALSGAQLPTEARVITDVKSLPAMGVVSLANAGAPGAATSVTGLPGFSPGTGPSRPTPGPLREAAAPAPAPAVVELETLMPELDNTLGFVGLVDGETLPSAQARVRVKGTAGATFKLTINGQEVASNRVGKRAVLESRQLAAWEYVGVAFRPGVNEVTVAQFDAFGNARGTATVRVKAPGELARLTIEALDGIADGKTPVKVRVKLTDHAGTPVTSRTPVTLEASRGTWQVQDPDAAAPGVQAFVEGGQADFLILPPSEPGAGEIVVTSGRLKAEARVDFLPELRSLVAAGVLEGIVNFRNLNTRSLTPARAADGFEQELRHLSKEWKGGRNDAGGRAAFFLKGKIKGEYLLTAAYDSEKETRERLFRDIQPDEFYPVYGDSGVRGFDAQSTSRLYVRVDHQKSYLLWGDFTTQATGGADHRKLSSYSRSLTGAKHHYENERVTANVFASRDNARQAIEELRANGTSGPYALASRGALVNSEKVEILVRDRNQPAVILSALPQSRFADYEIDPLTGRILFKSPVASVDRDLNPVSIRVTYEVEQGGDKFWVGGGEVQVKVTDAISVGGILVKDQNPQEPFTLAGANAAVRLGQGTTIVGEVARTTRGLGDVKGDAARLEVKHESESLRAQAFVARTERGFDNPGAYLSQGRSEAGARGEYKVRPGTTIKGEALRTEDLGSGAVRDGASVSVAHEIADRLVLEVGVRHAAEKGSASPVAQIVGLPAAQPIPDEVTTVRARLTGAVPFVERATVFAEAEVDVKDADRRVLAVGGEYLLENKGRVYARHEFISSITGPYGLNAAERQNTTALGIDTEYMVDGKLFSEYRIRDAMSGGDVEAAIGLRNLWSIAPGLKLATTVERVQSLSGTGQNENTALALALEYTGNPDWKGSTRLELRDATSSESLLFTVGLASRLSRDWTFLVRNILSLQKNKATTGLGTAPATAAGEHNVERFQAGLAYRDGEKNQWNALARIEHKAEKDSTQPGISLKRSTQILSVHADWQPIRPFLVTGRYAAKWTSEQSNAIATRYRAQLASVRGTWEFAPKWDMSVLASGLFGSTGGTRQAGAGVEIGYALTTNLWVSAGYNFLGFRDDELAGADYTAKGGFIRMRYKFDENLLGAGK